MMVFETSLSLRELSRCESQKLHALIIEKMAIAAERAGKTRKPIAAFGMRNKPVLSCIPPHNIFYVEI